MKPPTLALPIALTALACGSTEERVEPEPVAPVVEPRPEPEPPAAAEEPAPPLSFEDWGRETIALPPAFAPGLPAGEERLLFAPGMFDTEAEDFWSYVFVVRFEDRRLRSDHVADFLEQYYDGLMAAVAEDRGFDLERPLASVILARQPDDSYVAHVETVDAFVTGEPLSLRLVIRTTDDDFDGARMEVLASPHAETHGIWTRLADAVATIEL